MRIALVRSVTNNWEPIWVYQLIFPRGYRYGRTFYTLSETMDQAVKMYEVIR